MKNQINQYQYSKQELSDLNNKHIFSGLRIFLSQHVFFRIGFCLLFLFLLNLILCPVSFGSKSFPTKSFLLNHDYYEFPSIQVHKSSENVFSSPIAWYNDSIYRVDIEPPDGENNLINLKTVVRKGTIGDDGNWNWDVKVIENRTLDDRYHTQASIAIDKNGYIHVAYNMHNMPWQYAVSKNPEDISEFDFLGEELTIEQLQTVKWENKTPFPYHETAAIHGTQITYPTFFKDRNNELYITYRFATRPMQNWSNRGFAGGIAKYDATEKKWKSIGGNLKITENDALYPEGAEATYIVHPFAYFDRWSVYLIRLHFDINNSMHATWTWREDGAGAVCSHPSYALSDNNGISFKKADKATSYSLPVSLNDIDLISKNTNLDSFYPSTSISTDKLQQPYVVLNPEGSSRLLVHYDSLQKKWSEPERTPWGATEIFIDDRGKQWAFASGINIFSRDDKNSSWKHVFSDVGYGSPKIVYVKELDGFFIHCLSSDRTHSKVIWYKTGSLPDAPRNIRKIN